MNHFEYSERQNRNLTPGCHSKIWAAWLAGILLFATSPLAQADITVLHYYRMGEDDPGVVQQGATTSQTRDSVGTNDLTLIGGLPYSTNVSAVAQARVDSDFSVNFGAGRNGCSAALASTLRDNFGLEAWVKANSPSNSGTIAYNGNPSTSGWGLIQNGTNFQGLFGGVAIFGTNAVVTNVWTHLALVRDSGGATLYVNGVSAGTTAGAPNAPAGFFGVDAPPQVSSGQVFPGQIDELRVFTFGAGQFSTNDLLLNYTVSAPTIVTQYVWSVAADNAGVAATINPRGLSTRAFVQYGLTTNYTLTSATNFFPAIPSDTPTSFSLTGLIPGTIFNYRVVASNDAGVSITANQTFTTWGLTNYTVTSTNDYGVGTLREALATVGNGATISLAVTGTISLNSFLPLITNALTIAGPGATNLTISGGGSNRVFFVDAQGAPVVMSGFTIANGRAKGGNGGVGFQGAGGGLGAGGAIFVNAGNVTVSNLNFTGNSAVGGNGGAGTSSSNGGAGGGGGLGGDGGVSAGYSGGGGGGFHGRGGSALLIGGGGGGGLIGNGGNGGNSILQGGSGGGGGALQDGGNPIGSTGGAGGEGGGGTGGNDSAGSGSSNGTDGLYSGGGGGGGVGRVNGYTGGNGGIGGKFGGGGGAEEAGNGGQGGEFGGGGGCSAQPGVPGVSGSGGFGGGGAGVSPHAGGNGGFGGGSGGKACYAIGGGVAGAFGGRGAAGNYCLYDSVAGGGGGAALGGAIFVRGTNATFNWVDSVSDAGIVTPGQPGAGGGTTPNGGWFPDPGKVAGSALFLMGGTNVFTVSSGLQAIAGDIGGWTNTPVTFIKQGAGTLVLPATNTLPGATLVNGGTLRIDGDHRASINVTVNAGGVIAGRGRLAALRINDGGGLSPGASPGTLTAGNTVWSGAGYYNWQVLDAAGLAGTGYDVLTVNGTLDVSGASAFRINLWSLSNTNPEVNGAAANFTNSVARTWTLATTTAGVIGFNPANFVINTGAANGTGGFANPTAGLFIVAVSGSNLVLQYFPFRPVTAQTLPAAGVGPTTATLQGTVNPGGLATTYYFQYGFTTNYGSQSATGVLPAGVTDTPVSVSMSSLLPGYTYHYRVFASNSTSMAWGDDVMFTTLTLPPGVLTLPASNIAGTSATVGGSAIANGSATSYWFQYGATTNFGSSTPVRPLNNALLFDGATQSAQTINDVSLSNTSFTVEFWMRRDSSDRFDVAVNHGLAIPQEMHIGFRPENVFSFEFWSDTHILYAPGYYTDNAWHHWACTYNRTNNQRVIYRDGISVATDISTVNYVGSGPLRFARIPYHLNYFMQGALDEVRVWSVARGQADIAAQMSASLSGSEAGLLGVWAMNEGIGTVAADGTPNANTASLSNAPVWISDRPFSETITGLTPGTLYHFRVVASNSFGTSTGADLTFNTPAGLPIVTTLAATSVGPNSATLNGTVNPNGGATTWYFEHGPTLAYGNTTPAQTTSTAIVAVNAPISGLWPDLSYHFRLVGSNSAGVVLGNDVTLLTPAQPPTVQTLPATNVTFTSAAVRGSASANGAAAHYWYEYGTTTNFGAPSATNFLPPHNAVLRFNGANQSITTTQSLNLSNQSFTVEAWVRRAGTNHDDYFLQQGSIGVANRALTFGWRANDRFTFAFWNNDLQSSTPQTDTNWHHWAGTFDAVTRLRVLYRDGLVVASNTSAVVYQGTGTITLGRSPGAGTWFGGDLSEVRLWSAALSAADISSGMNFGMTGVEPGLLASWRLNDGSGLTADDASTNANHGTLVNAPAWVTPDLQPIDVTGLSPGTSYYVRLVAANAAGTSYGGNLLFTTLGVIAPQISQPVRLANGSRELSFASTPGAPFTVLATTNIGQPRANWTVLGPAIESPAGSGQFQFTDPQATNFAYRFYLMRSP